MCPICGDIVAANDTAWGSSLGPSSATASFAAVGDDLPPLPRSPAAIETTVHFAQTETLETCVEGPALPGFEILRELGRGGMGVVYLAKQTSLDRLVAVKLVRAGVDADDPEVDRFRAEAQAVATLQHPNVVQVFEVGTHEGRPYFTQEYLGGGDLAGKIGGTPWPPHKAADLVESLARAVQYAHERGIVHRDLKPANILFATDDLATAKITDFGIAKRLDARSDRTKTGMIIGSPSYMAPEQAAGLSREVGPRADVYALGAILYELLTGRPPFKAPTAMETVQQVVRDDPIPPARLVPRMPRDVETICLKCLEKAPARRYATAAALAEDLRHFRDNEPILARPVTRLEKVRKWTRRRPAAAALIGVSFLGLVLATVFGLRYQRDLTYERNRFLKERNEARRATEEEQKARAASERRRDQAIAAVDQMLARLGMDAGLASTPQMDAMRRQLLEDALGFYLKFLEEEGEDPVLRGKASEMAERTASILQLMGRHEEAEELYGKAIKWQEELAETHPDEPVYLYLLSQSQETLGDLYQRTGRVNDARETYRRSLENRKKLLAIGPNDPVYQCLDARIRVCLAQVEPDLGKKEAFLKESITTAESLVARHAAERRFAFVLGTARNTLGKLYLDAGRGHDAQRVFEANTKLYQGLVESDPSSNMSQAGLAMDLANLGQAIVLANGDLARSQSAHLQALEIRRRLQEEHPQILNYAVDVGHSHLWLGRLGYLQGDHQACRESCTKAIEQCHSILQRAPGEARIRPLLCDAHAYRFMSAEQTKRYEEGLVDVEAMLALEEASPLGPPGQFERLHAARILYLARLRRHREALEAFSAVPEDIRSAWDGDAYYGLACAWSHCGSAAEQESSISKPERDELIAKYTGVLLQMLEQVLKADRLSTNEQKSQLMADPELEWFRGRDSFQEFMSRVADESSKPSEPEC